jgi:hypothetical protein
LRVTSSGAPGTVVTRERLIDEVWDVNWFGSTKTLDVHVSGLRSSRARAGRSSVVVAPSSPSSRVPAGRSSVVVVRSSLAVDDSSTAPPLPRSPPLARTVAVPTPATATRTRMSAARMSGLLSWVDGDQDARGPSAPGKRGTSVSPSDG